MMDAEVWIQRLQQSQRQLRSVPMSQMFLQDPHRASRMRVQAAGLSLDYSKNRLDDNAWHQLIRWAYVQRIPHALQCLFRGDIVNQSEQRPALHTALRDPDRRLSPYADTIGDTIASVLARMQQITHQVHSGQWLGWTQQPVRYIVHVGIGGSHLGPHMAQTALTPYHNPALSCHYVANIDPAHLHEIWQRIEPEKTLFIIASKSFNTVETLTNAEQIRKNLIEAGCPKSALYRHFLAVSANTERALAFGIKPSHILPLWDWVGGRYSLCSAVGLVVCLATSFAHFKQLLDGARAMDKHCLYAPLTHNMPTILALLSIWYDHFWHSQTHAVLVYSHALRHFPTYLQQLSMESCGKSVREDGHDCTFSTSHVLWGGVGSNGQHSFHQLLHQGKLLTPVDFIVPLCGHHAEHANSHQYLVAQAFAQAQALMQGQSINQVIETLQQQGLSDTAYAALAAHKVTSGNRPSNMITCHRITPYTLGALIALYEHKVFIQAKMCHINPFDQWGIEWAKTLGTTLNQQLMGHTSLNELDSSTRTLVKQYRRLIN